jgi:2-polyprenyl-3-methyl-5-hydroxy-6-metoxy-1,4-benzoquinol methylase
MQVIVNAERNVACDSPDHLMPWGTRHDNFANQRFNYKLWALYPVSSVVKVLDLGCSGGGFVKSCIEDGHFAVGLEGSDFSKKYRRAAWATNPDSLFTCDVTRPFQVVQPNADGRLMEFDVVTAWEFIEHISEDDLTAVAANVHAHLAPGGLWILSVANYEHVVGGVRLHQTVRPKSWWQQKFESLGFKHLERFVKYFSPQFVRGRVDNEITFHLVLTNDPSKLPAIPNQSIALSLFDIWHGSIPQRYMRKVIVGDNLWGF